MTNQNKYLEEGSKPVVVVIHDTDEIMAGCDTVAEAEAWIEQHKAVDPTGVESGKYVIDAPEGM